MTAPRASIDRDAERAAWDEYKALVRALKGRPITFLQARCLVDTFAVWARHFAPDDAESMIALRRRSIAHLIARS